MLVSMLLLTGTPGPQCCTEGCLLFFIQKPFKLNKSCVRTAPKSTLHFLGPSATDEIDQMNGSEDLWITIYTFKDSAHVFTCALRTFYPINVHDTGWCSVLCWHVIIHIWYSTFGKINFSFWYWRDPLKILMSLWVYHASHHMGPSKTSTFRNPCSNQLLSLAPLLPCDNRL